MMFGQIFAYVCFLNSCKCSKFKMEGINYVKVNGVNAGIKGINNALKRTIVKNKEVGYFIKNQSRNEFPKDWGCKDLEKISQLNKLKDYLRFKIKHEL